MAVTGLPVQRHAATVTSVVALIDVVPAVGELIVTVHEPVAPAVCSCSAPTNAAVAPFEFVSEKLIVVPSGAGTKPPLLPITFT